VSGVYVNGLVGMTGTSLKITAPANSNIALGNNALVNSTVQATGCNVAIGTSTLQNATTITNAIAIGLRSLENAVTGDNNIAIGYEALRNAGSANSNIAIGVNAMSTGQMTSNAVQNIALGNGALDKITSGAQNVAIGTQALLNNTTGTQNVAIGYMANASCTTGDNNTSVGWAALAGCTVGSNNTCVGLWSGTNLTTGSHNVCIGLAAGAGGILTTGSNNIYIGNSATASNSSVTGEIVIGQGGVGSGANTCTINASKGVKVSSINLPVVTRSGIIIPGIGAFSTGMINLGLYIGDNQITSIYEKGLTFTRCGTMLFLNGGVVVYNVTSTLTFRIPKTAFNMSSSDSYANTSPIIFTNVGSPNISFVEANGAIVNDSYLLTVPGIQVNTNNYVFVSLIIGLGGPFYYY